MTKIESYMINNNFNATQFYIDIEGHQDNPSVSESLETIKSYSETFKILGTYPADRFRKAPTK